MTCFENPYLSRIQVKYWGNTGKPFVTGWWVFIYLTFAMKREMQYIWRCKIKTDVCLREKVLYFQWLLVRLLNILIQNYLQNNQMLLRNVQCFAVIHKTVTCMHLEKKPKTTNSYNQTELYFKASKWYFQCPYFSEQFPGRERECIFL